MPTSKVNEVNLYWELSGKNGDPLVLVHGSWGDHHNWDAVVNQLAKDFRVLTYDRRGHSKSERPQGQGNVEEDVSDLASLITHLDLSPAHIIGNSGGAAIVLKAAARKPELFKTLVVHEPPLFGLLKGIVEAQPVLKAVEARIGAVCELIATGEPEQAAKLFVETVAFGPGAWQGLADNMKQTFIHNAPTFLDEIKDPDNIEMDLSRLCRFDRPALVSHGTDSPPFFVMVVSKIVSALPQAKHATFLGAGHVPHVSHPEEYVKVLKEFTSAYQPA